MTMGLEEKMKGGGGGISNSSQNLTEHSKDKGKAIGRHTWTSRM